ncbi:extracellular solute-binding protein [Vallitalea pronyensis]|uniref:Extracellular solute-binding protein n=1 Tax=Vallitalea pronyensis TaxID=1348613 RepID=A0A8J8SIM9_9FIRM|nr:extracellular solute-binding protein [Vallitalea pronyensis]QUI24612.1 extracellular solute-binding protein [Vallitalea pronyensis]
MKKLLTLLMMVVMLFSLAACGSEKEEKKETDTGSTENSAGDSKDNEGSEEKIPLRLYTYYADTDVAVVDQAVARLEEKFPIEIEIIHRVDATGVELKTMAAVGKLPDIYEVTGETIINTFLESGDIEPLEDVMEENGVMEKVNPTSLGSLVNADGHTYAMNFEPPRNFLIYYNQSVFDEYGVKLPTNYDELLEATKTFADNKIIPFALFAAQPWPGIQFYDTIASRYNPGGVKALMDGTADITDPGYVRAAEQVVELVNAGFIGKSSFATNASQAFELFKTGKAAMIGNGTWYLLDIAEYGEGYGYLDNPLAEPGKEAETLYVRSGGSSQGGWTVNPKGEHVDLAKKVAIEYCIERAVASVELFGTANPLTYEVTPKEARHPAAQKYSDEIGKFESTTYFPWNIPNPEIATALNDNHQALLSGGITVEEFIADMDKVIKANR